MNNAKIKQAMVISKTKLYEFALYLRVSLPTARKYTLNPSMMKAMHMKRTDKLFRLPSGTTYKVAAGKINSEQFAELLNSLTNN